MELKTKYQYTYFIHPYTVDETRYDKYILKLFKDKKCDFKIFQKEKDLDIYNYFLPQVRNFAFPTFEFRDQKLKDFNNLSKETKSKLVSRQHVACFDYNLSEDIQGKMGEEDGIFFSIAKIQIICFNTGICFLAIKTHIEGNEDFSDLLDFNYRFKSINSEFSSLKDYENIKIQTDIFNDVKDISELISQITGIYEKKNSNNNKEELANSNFFVYSYVCVESDKWNEKNEFINIENEFYKYANCLPRQYLSDFNKTNIEQNLHIIDKFKYSKIALTNSSVNMICSGIDTFNYTKLPYQYENEYFYTYILTLYQKMFLKRINLDFKEYDKIAKMRAKFINFTKQIWEKEITLDDTGSLYYKTIKKTLELDELYEEIKTKYEVIYKELNIEKNNSYYSIIIILLIFSLIFNTVNILFLMYLLS